MNNNLKAGLITAGIFLLVVFLAWIGVNYPIIFVCIFVNALIFFLVKTGINES